MNVNALLARWRTLTLRHKVLALLAVSTAFLALMVAQEQVRRQTGTEIVLRARPVDPRDLLRGAYVALDYEAERVDPATLSLPADAASWRSGDKLFLGLREENGLWTPASLSRGKPANGPAIRVAFRNQQSFPDAPGQITIDIGADHYYADEPTAKALEKDIREGGLDVILAIGDDGGLSIKGLVLNGRKQYETLF
jgi:uncharacterized membrane-anchored protein